MNNASHLVVGDKPMLLRDIAPQDMPDLLALHRNVFGSDADPAWFDWKYRLGGGEGVGLWHEGQLIAHCGGVPRTFLEAGQVHSDLQIGDVMVAAQWRGILTRHGPFFHVSNAFYNSRLGSTKPYRVGYGFPNLRHLRLGMKSGLMWDGGEIHALEWHAQPMALHARALRLCSAAILPPDSPAFDARVNAAWATMQQHTQGVALGVRDSGYVRWRYLEMPNRSLVFLQLTRPWSGRVEGIAVLAPAPTPSAPMQWLDWIGSPARMGMALAACQQEAWRRGSLGLTAWTSATVAAHLPVQALRSRTLVAGIGVIAASAVSAEAAASTRWWLMGGDTDFL